MSSTSEWLGTLVTSVSLLVAPIGVGALAGAGFRRVRGRRARGLGSALGLLFGPAVVGFGLVIRFPVLGLWDAALEGLLCGGGLLGSAHHVLAERERVVWVASSTVASLILLELLCRLVLPPPPGFPSGQPHLLFADALSSDARHQPWDTLSKDIVCSVAYGEPYAPIFGAGASRPDVVTPRSLVPRAGDRRRVLHLGDSMAFGFALDRAETFTAALERLEPDVQHINASIPGTAPDAHFAVLRRWVTAQPVDLVVMYVFEGNDLEGLDSRHPCCGWQSLLVYGDTGVSLRCPEPTPPALDRAGFRWLRYHSPSPYLVRALVHASNAAAYLGHAMVLEPYFLADQSTETRLDHLARIVRAARDMLAARAIPLVVVVLPSHPEHSRGYSNGIFAALAQSGVRALDPSAILREIGEPAFLPDLHYTVEAHAALAQWLHSRLSSVDSPSH